MDKNKSQIIYLVLIIIIFIISVLYIVVKYNKEYIQNNWVQYRCNPLIMPFTSLFNVNPITNYQYCSWNIMKSFFAQLLQPIIYIIDLIFTTIKNMMNTLNTIRKFIFSIRTFIMKYIMNLMTRIENFTLTLRYTLAKVNDMIQKKNAIIMVFKYLMVILVYMLEWIKNIVRPIIIGIILAGIAMSIMLWFVFPAFAVILGILAAGAGIAYSCFHPSTLLLLKDNSHKPINQIKLGELLLNDNKVLGIITSYSNQLVYYKDIIITKDHIVNENGCWKTIQSTNNYQNYPNNSTNTLVYNLITSNNTITTSNHILCKDYLETKNEELNEKNLILSYLNGHLNYQLTKSPETISIFGFHFETTIKLFNGIIKSIKDINIGDILENGTQVTGLCKFLSTPDICFYQYKDIIVSGGCIVKDEDSIWKCIYDIAEKIDYQGSIFYNLFTNTTTIPINNIMFRDYLETNNKIINQTIENSHLSSINQVF